MNKTIIFLVVLLVLGGYFVLSNNNTTEEMSVDTSVVSDNNATGAMVDPVSVIPITHATAILEWDGMSIYTDPTGGAAAFEGMPEPDLIVVTDIHGDHLSVETLEAVITESTVIVAPQAVADEFSEALLPQTVVLANDETISEKGFSITATPMYNLPESVESRHTKGRGNGYVIEKDDTRLYIAGDTSDIPEMRALTDIAIAFVPMNLPFTMSVEDAADAVLEFKPATVYPFHYRGQDGLADTQKFKEIVNAGDPNIEVVLLDWYPETD